MKQRTECRKKSAFTLIELLVVMSIIGVLVLLAAPKFIGYTQKAKTIQMKHDISVIETIADYYLVEHEGVPAEWKLADENSVEKGEFISKMGMYDEEIHGELFEVPDSLAKKEARSSLPGKFFINKDGIAFYSAKAVTVSEYKNKSPFDSKPNIDAKITDKLEIIEVTFPSGYYRVNEPFTAQIKVKALQQGEYYASMWMNNESHWETNTDWAEYGIFLNKDEEYTINLTGTVSELYIPGFFNVELALIEESSGALHYFIYKENAIALYKDEPHWGYQYYLESQLRKGNTNIAIGGKGGVDASNVSLGTSPEEGNPGTIKIKTTNNSPIGGTGGMATVFGKTSYGTYDIMMKVPSSDSLLNGFFLYGDENHEIDIEVLKHPETGKWNMWTTIHNNSHPDYERLRKLSPYPNLEPGEIYQNRVDLEALGINPTSPTIYRMHFYPNRIAFEVLKDGEFILVSEWNNTFDYDDMYLHVSSFYTHWLKNNFTNTESMEVYFIRRILYNPLAQ